MRKYYLDLSFGMYNGKRTTASLHHGSGYITMPTCPLRSWRRPIRLRPEAIARRDETDVAGVRHL